MYDGGLGDGIGRGVVGAIQLVARDWDVQTLIGDGAAFRDDETLRGDDDDI